MRTVFWERGVSGRGRERASDERMLTADDDTGSAEPIVTHGAVDSEDPPAKKLCSAGRLLKKIHSDPAVGD